MTAVVSQSIPMRDLIEAILATTGKDNQRVREVLLRGAVVQGASRFRWQSLNAGNADLDAVLRTFPDADRTRPFRPADCLGVRIRGSRHIIELPRQIAAKRRFLKRRSFWDALLAVAHNSLPEYVDYSYRTRSDEYRVRLSLADAAALRNAASLLRYPGLANQVQEAALESVEYFVPFP